MHDIVGFSSAHKNSVVVDERADLAALSATICKEHEAATLSLSYALEHGMACGDALLKAKPTAGPHGTWLAWLERLEPQGGPSVRMAQNYMRLAENRAVLAAAANTKQRFAFGTVRGALALIRQPRPPSAPRSKSPSSVTKAPKLTRHDVLAWFGTAPVVEHQRLFDSLGSRVVAAAIPQYWNMRLASAGESVGRITAPQCDATIRRRHPHPDAVSGIPDDIVAVSDDGLDIPACLARAVPPTPRSGGHEAAGPTRPPGRVAS
jgi:hypothetical protein